MELIRRSFFVLRHLRWTARPRLLTPAAWVPSPMCEIRSVRLVSCLSAQNSIQLFNRRAARMASWFGSPAKAEEGQASPTGSAGSARTQQPSSVPLKSVTLISRRSTPTGPHMLTRSAMELETKHNDAASTVLDDEIIGKEELQMIKARTMFQMTEELHGVGDSGRKRLLFLTNSQAELIASSEASMQKMLDALEIPRPKLVINLIASAGHSDYATKAMGAEIRRRADAGILRDKGSFASAEEERKALAKLDHFMASVILPLAAQTNAIIFCNACAADCMLAASLTRMLSVHRSTWGKEPPFTVLSATCSVSALYQNPDMTAVWRSVRRASRAWRQRDTAILEATCALHKNEVPELGVDLDPNAMIYLLVDAIDHRGIIGDRGAFLKLSNELLRYLATSLPSLTIKTGHSDKPTLDRATQHTSSLAVA